MTTYYTCTPIKGGALAVFLMLQSCLLTAQIACPENTPGANDCENVFCIPCNLDGYMGSTAGYGYDPDQDLQFCATVENVQYIMFMAAVSDLTIIITPKNCLNGNGLDAGVMSGCDQYPLSYCVAGIPGNGIKPVTISMTGLTVGSKYVLVIDGVLGDVCDFTIHTIPPNGTEYIAYQIPANLALQGDTIVCAHTSTVYALTPSSVSTPYTTYTWTAPPGTLINGAPPPYSADGLDGAVVFFTWGTTGGQICVQPTNACYTGPVVCKNVSIKTIPNTQLPPVTLCPEEAPYTLPWDSTVYGGGTFVHHYLTPQGCDSAVLQKVTFLPQNEHTLPPFAVCPGDCVTVCDEDFCQPGFYITHCISAAGCDSTVKFSIVSPTPVAEILDGGPITCTHPVDTLNSAASPGGSKTWTNALGQTIGAGNSVVVTAPGTYTLTTAMTLAGKLCSVSDTIVVLLDKAPPPITASGVSIGCDTLPALLHAASPDSTAAFAWTGPNGFSALGANPAVTDTGRYIVVATNPANGCSATDTVAAKICCHTFAGTLDSMPVHVCGEKTILVSFHNDSILAPGDVLFFVLYADPADPVGSVLEYTSVPEFPFVPGLLSLSVSYYVAAVAGHLLANDSVDVHSPCFSLSAGAEVEWLPKPAITVEPVPPELCKGDCKEVTFHFTGSPPFAFHYEITQNGAVVFAQDENSDTPDKTIQICPGAFNPPVAAGPLDFRVDFFRDAFCTCAD